MTRTEAAEDSAFKTFAIGETVTKQIDLTRTYDLSAGGDFELFTRMTISIAESGNSSDTKSSPVESNKMTTNVNGREAAAAREHNTRQDIDRRFVADKGSCSPEQLEAIEAARGICRERAFSTWTMVTQPWFEDGMLVDARFNMIDEFFKDHSKELLAKIAYQYANIYHDCSSTHDGHTTHYCRPEGGSCSDGIIGFATHGILPTVNSSAGAKVGYCPLFFDDAVHANHEECHHNDKPSVLMHELSHLYGLTHDHAYGYGDLRKLNATQNSMNADTVALFAKGKRVHFDTSYKSLTSVIAVHNNCRVENDA